MLRCLEALFCFLALGMSNTEISFQDFALSFVLF